MEVCPKCDSNMDSNVCIDCIKDEILEWIGRENKKIVEIVTDITDDLKIYKCRHFGCIFCNRKINLCEDCYKQEVYNILREADSKLAETFLAKFMNIIPIIML